VHPHLRVARLIDKLERVANMYRDGYLNRRGYFEGHSGFDTVVTVQPRVQPPASDA